MASVGKVYRGRGRRWFLRLPSGIQIHCDKQHRSFYSEEHARWTLAQIQGEIANGTFDPDFYAKGKRSIKSFRTYGEMWLDNCRIRQERGELSPNYVRDLAGYLHNHWLPFFGETDITEIRGKELNRFYLQLQGSPKTRHNIMQALRKLCRDAYLDEVISATPRFPRLERLPEPQVHIASVEEQDAIMAHLGTNARYMVLFCVSHGVRVGEARALQHRDIDLKNETVTIRRAFSGTHLRPHPKGKRQRVIPLLDETWKEMYVNAPKGLPGSFVFTASDGKPRGVHYAREKWYAACKKAGFEPCGFHEGTRHSLASQLIARGESVYLVKELLGHADIKTTERYTHLNVEPLRRLKRGTVTKLTQHGKRRK